MGDVKYTGARVHLSNESEADYDLQDGLSAQSMIEKGNGLTYK